MNQTENIKMNFENGIYAKEAIILAKKAIEHQQLEEQKRKDEQFKQFLIDCEVQFNETMRTIFKLIFTESKNGNFELDYNIQYTEHSNYFRSKIIDLLSLSYGFTVSVELMQSKMYGNQLVFNIKWNED